MSKSAVVKWFFGSLIGLTGGLILLVVVGALAVANDVFIMSGPDVVGIRSGALAFTFLSLVGLAVLVMLAAAVAMFVAWIGAILNTANLRVDRARGVVPAPRKVDIGGWCSGNPERRGSSAIRARRIGCGSSIRAPSNTRPLENIDDGAR